MSLADEIRRAEELIKEAPGIGPHRIFESVHMVRPYTVELTWRERLLSWPWRPWYRTRQAYRPRTDVIRAELPNALGQSETVLICHPTVAARIRDEIGLT